MNSRRVLSLSLKLGCAGAVLLILTCLSFGWIFSGMVLQPGHAKEFRTFWAKSAPTAQLNDFIEQHEGRRLRIASEYGYDLAACYLPAVEKTRLTAVIVHPYADRKEQMIPFAFLMRSLGYNVLLYDQRDCGDSGGSTMTMGYYEQHDLCTVVSKARALSGRGTKVVVVGVSMGASVALLLAGSGDPGADLYVADSPFSDFLEQGTNRLSQDFPAMPVWAHSTIMTLSRLTARLRSGARLEEVSPIQTANLIKAPVLYFSSKEDNYVAPHMVRDLYKATRSRKTLHVFEKGGHAQAIELHPIEYREVISKFLEENGML